VVPNERWKRRMGAAGTAGVGECLNRLDVHPCDLPRPWRGRMLISGQPERRDQ
jgi:hypothetical protein